MMKIYWSLFFLVLLVTARVAYCEVAAIDSAGGHFSYSVEGDWPFGAVSGTGVELPESAEVAEGVWALIVKLKDRKTESSAHPTLYISMEGKEAPLPGTYPLSFAKESTDYTAMVIGPDNSIQVVSGSGVLDIIVSDKKRLEGRFEFQADDEMSMIKGAVVKGRFLAVPLP